MSPVPKAESPRVMLERLSLKAKHSWGQNFLGDEMTLERIVDEAMIVPTDTVLELGAGLGHLTRMLLTKTASVVAVERDRDLVQALKGLELPSLRLVEANAAELNFAQAAQCEDIILVGNLPYHLTSSILFQVLDQADNVRRAVFTLQKEVVDRVCAPPGGREGGLLSVLLGLRFYCEYCFKIGSAYFHPPPKVDSAVLKLTRRSQPAAPVNSEARFRRVVKAGFAQRRKTLTNSLKSDEKLFAQHSVESVLAAANIDGKRRAETLSVEEFAAIERALGPL
jgi:16S rRNA (adenine1518-N6/adenine1519-N6)-dimethyltransferase